MQFLQRHITPDIRTGQPKTSGAHAPLLLQNGKVHSPSGPFTVYAKIAGPALVTAAIWLKTWLGIYPSLGLVCCIIAILIHAPRLKSDRSSSDSWAQQVSFGERIWLNRLVVPIPSDVNRGLTLLHLVSWTGILVAILGAATASLLLTGTGLAVTYACQAVSIGQFIRLYRDMKDKAPLYRFWTVVGGNDNARTA